MRYETIEVSEAELKEILCKHFEIESRQVLDMQFVSEIRDVNAGNSIFETYNVGYIELLVKHK